jgi:hypothetical protein
MRVVEGLSGGFLWWVGKQGGIVSTVEVGLVRCSVLCVVRKKCRVLRDSASFAKLRKTSVSAASS